MNRRDVGLLELIKLREKSERWGTKTDQSGMGCTADYCRCPGCLENRCIYHQARSKSSGREFPLGSL